MAEAQRSAFAANLAQLSKALEAEGKDTPADVMEAGKSAVMGLATLIFYELDRIADALEARNKEPMPKTLGELRIR